MEAWAESIADKHGFTEISHTLRFPPCPLPYFAGVAGFRGATVDGGDLLGLAAGLAREAGIIVRW